MTRPALELRPGQHLTLTPQLQQSIRLLQLSSLELEAEISLALADNPLLERDENPAEQVDSQREASIESDDSSPEIETRLEEMPGSGGVYPDEEEPQQARADTLREHLLGQLALTRAGPRDAALVEVLIEELDDNGYLGSPLVEIAAIAPTRSDSFARSRQPCHLALCARDLRAASVLAGLRQFGAPA